MIGADASHAWISVYVPQVGWVEFDSTNNVIPGRNHITVAYGRDYDEQPPLVPHATEKYAINLGENRCLENRKFCLNAILFTLLRSGRSLSIPNLWARKWVHFHPVLATFFVPQKRYDMKGAFSNESYPRMTDVPD